MKPAWLIPPGLNGWQKRALAQIQTRVPVLPNFVWVLSSGTQSLNQVKCIGLEKSAIEASAVAVNAHLKASAKDRWLVAIPTYHVGGFAIAIRAKLVGAKVFTLARWQPKAFHAAVVKNKISLVSLVPTQIHDLVSAHLSSAPSLRAIVVGGGSLSPELYQRARDLGWPVLPSYGLTETASQVATASLKSLETSAYPDLAVLPHANIELREGRICVRATSVAARVAVSDGTTFSLEDPRRAGWLITADLGEWRKDGFRVRGRIDDIVKVLGQLVSLPQLEGDLRSHLGECAVIAVDDARAGKRLIAVTDADQSIVELDAKLHAYNRSVRKSWQVSQVCWVKKLPRTALGKLKKAELTVTLKLR